MRNTVIKLTNEEYEVTPETISEILYPTIGRPENRVLALLFAYSMNHLIKYDLLLKENENIDEMHNLWLEGTKWFGLTEEISDVIIERILKRKKIKGEKYMDIVGQFLRIYSIEFDGDAFYLNEEN